MTISYYWLCTYLPERIEPEKLSKILTSIGLEVESLQKFESVKGGLKGLVIGEVIECVPHPNADKLKLTKVNTGEHEPLQIVCGAPNVAAGQKVVVATVGTTIYPDGKEALTMKVAKIRGVESYGMICAEDEIGLSTDHAGIMVLPEDVRVGTPAPEYFSLYEDWVYEIGLTPNRMDAMSHYGVARDVCAYLSHHNNKETRPIAPKTSGFKTDNHDLPIEIHIENTSACQRYAGVSIKGVQVKESPQWLKNALLAIGLRPINNIVDATNYILHESGQPLHAFDADEIKGNKVIVKNMPEGTPFVTLDEKERKLNSEDLMICNEEAPMCIGGVFGGIKSGVKDTTTNLFLESAWFSPESIRKSSFRHSLRTDAALRFEKGVDISNTANVLKRATLLIKELAGGEISSDIIDIYPKPQPAKEIGLKYHYLKKLSGKNYHPDAIKRILTALGFEIMKEGMDELYMTVPFSKTDVSLPADIVEEILRIDGLDNIPVPSTITITPSSETVGYKDGLYEKLSGILVGKGFNEIMTNSITNSKYYPEKVLDEAVTMMNNLSADLDILRPSMLETGLEVIAYNLNRQIDNLKFFEIGKTYHKKEVGNYSEIEHLSIYLTGSAGIENWNNKGRNIDFYYSKGLVETILAITGVTGFRFEVLNSVHTLEVGIYHNRQLIGSIAELSKKQLQEFDIKQPVYWIDINLFPLLQLCEDKKITYKEVSKYPSVQRDLALIVDKQTPYSAIEAAINKIKLPKLKQTRLFDIFESEKLGNNKKSMAINFTFLDEEKTLTDKEIDGFVQKIIGQFEKELGAEIRK